MTGNFYLTLILVTYLLISPIQALGGTASRMDNPLYYAENHPSMFHNDHVTQKNMQKCITKNDPKHTTNTGQLIIYNISGMGSFRIDDAYYPNTPFTISIYANTSDVFSRENSFSVFASPARIYIKSASIPYIFLGIIYLYIKSDHQILSLVAQEGGDLITINDPVFEGYNLKRYLDPVSDTDAYLHVYQFQELPVTNGRVTRKLSCDHINSRVKFEATLY